MASSRDITAASINNVGDDFTEEANTDNEKPSTRYRIACQTGHILNNLTSSMWYSYALLYFQEVVGLYPINAGILFFISQILTVVTFLVIRLGRDKRIWNSFSAYGIQKARHVVASAIILFAWPFTATPCLFCGDDSSSLALGMYYLMPVVLLSVGWPLADASNSSLMREMRTENGKLQENSRSVARICQVCLYILLWVLLQQNTEQKVNSQISEQFTYVTLVLVPVGFLFVFAFHFTVLESRPQSQESKQEEKTDEEKNYGRSTADIPSPSSLAEQEIMRIDGPKIKWYEWLKEPVLYKVGFVVLFVNNALKIVQSYLPLYLTETLQLRKESIAFFPLIIVMTRIATEITCKGFIEKQTPRVVILCTTFAIFGTCMWYFLQSAEQTWLVYAPTVIFACMSSLVTMVTSNLHREMMGHNEEVTSFVSATFECTERGLLGLIVLTVQIFSPAGKNRALGSYLRSAFPAAFGSCIVVPMLVATAFMSSRSSSEGPELTITVASPREDNEPIQTSLPLMNCAYRLASSETSTPPVDVEHNEIRTNTDGDCTELQGSRIATSPSHGVTEETQTGSQREQDIDEVKQH